MRSAISCMPGYAALACLGSLACALWMARDDAAFPSDGSAAAVSLSPLSGGTHVSAGGTSHWRRDPDGFFYVEGLVNDRPVRFLVDTGASVTVLTPADAERVGATGATYGGTLSTVGGQTPMRWTRLKRLAVAGHAAESFDAVVLSQPGGVSLLGQDVLKKMESVSIRGDELTLG